MKTNNVFRWFGGMALLFGLMTQGMAQSGNTGADAPEESSTPVYQSFFEGNPVYYQTWENYYHADAAGGLIKKHGLEGDTLVNGLLYHRMSVKGNGGEWEDEYRVQFWVRESETHDKVWVRMPWDTCGQEVLVVDLNLKEKDSFLMYGYEELVWTFDSVYFSPSETYYVVDSVYYLEHPGGVLKHIRLSPQDYNGYTKVLETTRVNMGRCEWKSRHLEFIEGVGSNLGFVYGRNGMVRKRSDPLWGLLYQNDESVLLDYIVCIEKDSVIYYVHPNPECAACDAREVYQWIYEPDDPREPPRPPRPANERVQSMSRYLSVSPNPAAATATLQWDASTDSRVSMASCNVTLYDMQGVRLRSYTIDRWPYTLSVSDLAPGAYLLRVVPTDTPSEGAWQATVRLMVR